MGQVVDLAEYRRRKRDELDAKAKSSRVVDQVSELFDAAMRSLTNRLNVYMLTGRWEP